MLDSLLHQLLQRATNRRPVRAEGILECGVECALGLLVKKLVDEGLLAAAPGQTEHIFSVHLACLRPFAHRKAKLRRKINRSRFET